MRRTAAVPAAAWLVLSLLWPAARAAAGWSDTFAPPPGGQGLDDRCDALILHDGHLYAGGQFLQAGSAEAWGIARWDSIGWEDLSGGLNARVSALAVYEGDLVAGGRFTSAGGVAVRYVARWDGVGWHPLGDPGAWVWNDVLALAVQDTALWAAGSGFVVRWDGAAWQAVTGPLFTADVFALAVYDGQLVAGGAFTAVIDPAGGVTAANRLAVWDGGGWSALGAGADGTVYGLTVWNGTLIAGGVFAVPANIVAAWDGNGWFGLGTGLTGSAVVALAPWGPRLIVGGDFSAAGGGTAARLALWNGTSWSAPSGGVNGLVRTALGVGTDLWTGGDFTNADTLASSHIGRWTDPTVGIAERGPPSPVMLGAPYPNPFNPQVSIPVSLPRPAAVTVTIHDLGGRLVRTLWRGVLPAGRRLLTWDGRDEAGRRVATGPYLLRCRPGGRRHLVLVR